MRVTKVAVASWRNLRDVDLRIDADDPLVCLVGENGTGKSTVLELLSAAAHRLGIAQGIEIPRGNPFEEEHDIEVAVEVSTDDVPLPEYLAPQLAEQPWDGRIRLRSRRTADGQQEEHITAGGVPDHLGADVATAVVGVLRQRQETQHLYLVQCPRIGRAIRIS